VCFPDGPAGAHRLINRSESIVRALFLSTTGVPANVCYPDTGDWLIHNRPGDDVEVHETDTIGRSQAPRGG
jgi:uncharacterized cupin superfamily protein